jgi:L-amino acid N-acyltransferase YncA
MLNNFSYRKFVTLTNGRKVMFRFINGQDHGGLTELYSEAPPEASRLMKQDVFDPEKLNEWLDHLDYCRLIPLIAIDLEGNQPIGIALLHRGQHTARHVGEIQQVFVCRPFQGLGLGSLMLQELINLAQKDSLQWLKAEVAVEQKNAVKAFEAKGFSIKAFLEDFLIGKDGVTHNVLLLTRPVLNGDAEEF